VPRVIIRDLSFLLRGQGCYDRWSARGRVGGPSASRNIRSRNYADRNSRGVIAPGSLSVKRHGADAVIRAPDIPLRMHDAAMHGSIPRD
jgi:hypothetical protein